MAAGHRQYSFPVKVVIAAAIVTSVVLGLVLLYFTFDILLLVFAAALIAIFLRGVADVLKPVIPVSDGLRVGIVAALLIAVMAGAIALLAPSISEQAGVLRAEIPRSARNAAETLSQYQWAGSVIAQLPSIDDVMARLDASTIMSRVGGYFSSTVGVIGSALMAILLAIYFAIEPRFYSQGFLTIFPKAGRKRAGEILEAIYQTLRWWLIGKAGSMLFIGIITWIGLSILGIPLALTLGLIAGLLSFIPNFGPILSALPALLLAFIEGPEKALWVLLLFVGVQLVESNIVTPIIERETVELPPALTIVFQLALGTMIGGLGLVLATPLLAVVVVLVKLLYMEELLGEPQPEIIEGEPAT